MRSTTEPRGGVRFPTPMTPRTSSKRPGLAKAGALPLVSRRSLPLVKSTDYRLRELFERADVISEGKTREEAVGATYYGSTSIHLPFTSHGGSIPDVDADVVAALLAKDPHARLRAVRVACLEAQVRALHPIGKVRAELAVLRDARGLRIHVEVEAPVFQERVRKGVASGAKRTRGARARS